jgi:hypothetical protein
LKSLVGAATILAYAAVPVAAVALVMRRAIDVDALLFDVVLAAVPMVLLALVTWRLVWPRWKLVAKLVVHPSIYAILSLWIGHWCILVAWIHQGLLGLGGHIWFSRKHGFTWYAVEDPARYVELSKRAAASLSGGSVDSQGA